MKKPTKEELEAQLQATTEQAEKEKAEADEKKKKEVEEIPDVSDVEPSEPVPSEPVPTPSEPVPSEPEEEPTPSEPVPSPDYKEKFSNSSRENQKIYAKNRKINEAVAKAAGITEVDQAELQAEFPDWDVMSETEQRLAKDNFINKKRFDLVAQATEEAKKIEKWSDDVAKYIEDPKVLVDNPKLEGKEQAFIEFANQAENHSVPFKVLTSAFLHDMSTKAPVKNKGKMMESGTGGPNTKSKAAAGKITFEQGQMLRQANYAKYKQYLLAGKIEDPEL